MIKLKNANGLTEYVQEGGSALVEFTLYNPTGDQLAETAILTLTARLTDKLTETVINSRDATSIIDANGGSIEPDGSVDLILGPLDNVIVNTGSLSEVHVLQIEWTWNDDQANSYTGKEEYCFTVEADYDSAEKCSGWIG